MQYGMNLLLWNGDLGESDLPTLEMLKKLGYDGVELPMFNLDVEKFAMLGRWLDSLGLARTGVTIRTGADNPISPDPKIRAVGVAKTKLTLDCCKAAGAAALIGPYHSAIGEFSGAGPTRDEWRWGVDSMREVAEYADKLGIMLGVEYLNRFETYLLTSAADAVRFVKDVDHPRCLTMYDTFHANIEEKGLAEAIRVCASAHAASAYFGKRSRHARPRPRRLENHFRHAGRSGLRRLARGRGIWTRPARDRRGHEDLASDV